MCTITQIVPVKVFAETKHNPEIITEIIIKDVETGKIEEYKIENDVTETIINNQGEITQSSTVTVDDETISNRMRVGQSNNNTFSGWKGTVNIQYSDDGTYAALKQATASWKRVSGSTSISNKTLNYGQDLGTNSKHGSINFTNGSTAVVVNWPKGKYAYNVGHKVVANLSAKIKGKYVYVYCNVKF